MKPFEYQEEIIADCMRYLHDTEDKKPGIVVAPVAAGKSLIISSVAKKWGRPCLVLQPNKELLQQNLEKLRLL